MVILTQNQFKRWWPEAAGGSSTAVRSRPSLLIPLALLIAGLCPAIGSMIGKISDLLGDGEAIESSCRAAMWKCLPDLFCLCIPREHHSLYHCFLVPSELGRSLSDVSAMPWQPESSSDFCLWCTTGGPHSPSNCDLTAILRCVSLLCHLHYNN